MLRKNTETLEKIMGNLGDFGRYQCFQCLLLVLTTIPTGIHMISLVTIAGVPDHRCAIEGIDSSDHTEPWNSSLVSDVIPLNDQGNLDSCKLYGDNATLRECNAWIYDTTYYTMSRGIEWNFVCSRRWMSAVAQSAFMCGVILGSLVLGPLCDKFGRKIIYCWSALFQLLSAVMVAFSTEYYSFVVQMFIYGIFTISPFKAGYVLLIELIGPSKRTVCATMYQLMFGVGVMLVGVWGYLIDNQFYLQIVYALHSAVLLPHWFLIDESPRWLWAKGRVGEALAIIEKGMKINRSTKPLDSTFLLSDTKAKAVRDSKTHSTSILDLFRTPNMLKKTAIICGCWFATALIYFGLSLNASKLNGNPFLLISISGFVELPGTIIAMYFVNRFGHRALLSTTLLLSGFSLITIIGLPYRSTATITAVMIGKSVITGTYSIIFKFTAELFPTVVRSSGVGLGSVCSSFAASLTPFISLMDSFNPLIPTTVFGLIAIIFGVCSLLLPETLGRRLPQTLEDGEKFGIGDTCFTNCRGRRLSDSSIEYTF